MGADCKSVGFAFEGSNPSPATQARNPRSGARSPGLGFLLSGCRVGCRMLGGEGQDVTRAPMAGRTSDGDHAVAAGGLGPVHGAVGPGDEFVGIFARAKEGDADADPGCEPDWGVWPRMVAISSNTAARLGSPVNWSWRARLASTSAAWWRSVTSRQVIETPSPTRRARTSKKRPETPGSGRSSSAKASPVFTTSPSAVSQKRWARSGNTVLNGAPMSTVKSTPSSSAARTLASTTVKPVIPSCHFCRSSG